MNNDRVRIYDLSKEVNLENKELLAICNQLNIPAKSHSSTIEKTDAERIRAVAEKHTAVGASSRKKSASTSPLANGEVAAKAQSKPSLPSNQQILEHKQQILEIRKLKAEERINSNSKELQLAARSPQSSVGSPVAPRPYSPPPAPMKPTAPTRPALSTNQSKTTQLKADVDSTPPTNQSETTQLKADADSTPPTNQSETTQLKADADRTPGTNQRTEISAKAQAVPELAKPPTRPVPPVAPRPEPRQEEQSEPKRETVNQTPDKSVETITEVVAQKPVRPASVASTSKQETPKVQSVSQLQRAKVARQVEPETLPVPTRKKLTVVTAEPKVVEEKPERLEIVPEAEAVPEPPQLAKPPTRPVAPVAPTPRPPQEEPSGAKPEKVKPTGKNEKVKPTSKKSIETTKETAVQKPVRPTKVASKSAQEAPKAQSVVELRQAKPARSVGPKAHSVVLLPMPSLETAASKGVEGQSDSVALLDDPVELLDRPHLPRPVKGWKTPQ